jgi:molecular chaperone GrpE (heat shock protein)
MAEQIKTRTLAETERSNLASEALTGEMNSAKIAEINAKIPNILAEFDKIQAEIKKIGMDTKLTRQQKNKAAAEAFTTWWQAVTDPSGILKEMAPAVAKAAVNLAGKSTK